jgi:hypothetical protein
MAAAEILRLKAEAEQARAEAAAGPSGRSLSSATCALLSVNHFDSYSSDALKLSVGVPGNAHLLGIEGLFNPSSATWSDVRRVGR